MADKRVPIKEAFSRDQGPGRSQRVGGGYVIILYVGEWTGFVSGGISSHNLITSSLHQVKKKKSGRLIDRKRALYRVIDKL